MEIAAVILAVAYLLLAMRENRWCWPAGIASSLLYLAVFFAAGLYMESGLQLFYGAMSVYGWRVWRPAGSGEGAALSIQRWPLRWHGAAVLSVTVISLTSGYFLHHYTPAAAPYLDSFVTWSSVLTTWMVARKVLENWLYWFLIDSLSIYVYARRGLWLTAGLFVAYLVLIVIGYATWRRQLRQLRP